MFKARNLAIRLRRIFVKTVCRAKPEQLSAHYVPNQTNRHLEKNTEAFFIKQLTDCTWVPDREGNFLKPADLTLETLHPDFPMIIKMVGLLLRLWLRAKPSNVRKIRVRFESLSGRIFFS